MQKRGFIHRRQLVHISTRLSITMILSKSFNREQSGLWRKKLAGHGRAFGLHLCLALGLCLAAQAQKQPDPGPRQTLEVAREYLRRGEWQKAADTYQRIAKEPTLVSQVWPGYLEALRQIKDYAEAERYLRRLSKATRRPEFTARLGLLYAEQGKAKEAERARKDALGDCKTQDAAALLSRFYDGQARYAEAIDALLLARKLSGERHAWSYDLSRLYGKQGNTDAMLDELFGLAERDPSTLAEVQGMLQNSLDKPEETAAFERRLLAKLQQDPQNETYGSLLYWLYVQQKDFEGAFIQAKALDRRLAERGGFPNRILEVAQLARNAEAYGTAADIYQYVVETYANSPAAFAARRQELEMRRQQLEATYPIDRALARRLLGQYGNLVQQAAPQEQAGLYYEMGRLTGFYLGKADSAVHLFEQAIQTGRYNPERAARAKLDLGDLYLIRGEPWESTLLYSQVEKDNKDQPLGYEAKLRNARLSFYRGEFLLAEEHLGVLKQATSREIANDALQLALMISDNLVKDTTGKALRVFARAELLQLETQYDWALQTLDSIPLVYKGDDLEDDVLYRKAQIYTQTRRYPQAVEAYKALLERFAESIYADDALFTQAVLTEERLKDKPAAMALYERLLQEQPGSVFVAEARKRYRALRGDGV